MWKQNIKQVFRSIYITIIIKSISSELNIIMERANEPIDINWRNMGSGGARGIYFCRRFFLNIAAILILLFLSTPTVTIDNIIYI